MLNNFFYQCNLLVFRYHYRIVRKLNTMMKWIPGCARAGSPAYAETSEAHITGFTLLEVMLAMAILAIVLVAVFQSQAQSISMTSRARFETTAALLAQSRMAEIEAADTGDISPGRGDFDEQFPDYSWQVDLSDTELENVKKIEVIVTNDTMTSNNTYSLVLYKFILR
jgi:general secretion pathway protein I